METQEAAATPGVSSNAAPNVSSANGSLRVIAASEIRRLFSGWDRRVEFSDECLEVLEEMADAFVEELGREAARAARLREAPILSAADVVFASQRLGEGDSLLRRNFSADSPSAVRVVMRGGAGRTGVFENPEFPTQKPAASGEGSLPGSSSSSGAAPAADGGDLHRTALSQQPPSRETQRRGWEAATPEKTQLAPSHLQRRRAVLPSGGQREGKLPL